MIRLVDISKEAKQENIEKEAFKWIMGAIMTSNTSKPSLDIIKFLSKYPIDDGKPVYRGIGLVRQRLDREKIIEINNLKIGDYLPSYLSRNSEFSSYTKKLFVAKKYSEGRKSIVVESIIDKKNTIIDLEFFAKILRTSNNIFDKEDLEYMRKDKEVLMIEPVKSKIIYIKGNL